MQECEVIKYYVGSPAQLVLPLTIHGSQACE